MTYQTVFDASFTSFRDWPLPLTVGILFFVGSVAQLRMSPAKMKKLNLSPRYNRLLGVILLTLSCVWTTGIVYILISEHMNVSQELRNHDYRSVVGSVESFKPLAKDAHGQESFQVAGVVFSYSDAELSECFNNTLGHGGPIREHIPVRILYHGNCILKLQVAR